MHENAKDKLNQAVGALFAALDCDISARKPVCRQSGRCCKFESYGHLMYVTQIELTYFANLKPAFSPVFSAQDDQKSARHVSLQQFFAQENFEGCPYQVGGLCTAREARPLGCRIYFCDENAKHWQNEVYEKYHAQLVALHETFGLDYRYIEWRAGLREIMAAENNAAQDKSGDGKC